MHTSSWVTFLFECRGMHQSYISIKTTYLIYFSYFSQVMVCFFEKVYRGNRCIKADADGFSAFASPNMPPLVQLQVKIKGEVIPISLKLSFLPCSIKLKKKRLINVWLRLPRPRWHSVTLHISCMVHKRMS